MTNAFDAAERVGVSLLANESTDAVPSEKAGLEKTVRKLSAMLDETAAYVSRVNDGKIPRGRGGWAVPGGRARVGAPPDARAVREGVR